MLAHRAFCIGAFKTVVRADLWLQEDFLQRVSPVHLFTEYYRQILRALRIKGYKAIYCGEIPPIHADGHVFFDRPSAELRLEYNAAIRALIEETPQARFVPMKELPRSTYVDPVHFNEDGNILVAESFADIMVAR